MPTVNLTPAELATITKHRLAAEKINAEREKKEAYKAEQERKATAAREAKIQAMIDALIEADDDNILSMNYKGQVNFMIGDQVHLVEIAIHNVYRSSRSIYSTNKGWKYRLSGDFNNYADRWYKSPKTVLSKIKAFQFDHQMKIEDDKRRESLKDRALEELRNKYPQSADIEYQNGYAISRTKNVPNRIVVKGDHGSVSFTFYDTKDGIKFGTFQRSINNEISEEVNNLILGK